MGGGGIQTRDLYELVPKTSTLVRSATLPSLYVTAPRTDKIKRIKS